MTRRGASLLDTFSGAHSLSVLRIKNTFGNLPLFISKIGRILAHDFVGNYLGAPVLTINRV